jgi:hypothetical protein
MHIIDFSGFFVKGEVKNRGIRNNAIQSPPTIHSRKEPKKQFLGTIKAKHPHTKTQPNTERNPKNTRKPTPPNPRAKQ